MLPFVTVYGITYRQPTIVRETVLGLWKQQYPTERYEIIILDDGSDDETNQILLSLSKASPVPMNVILTSHDRHYASAIRWNQCIKVANPLTTVYIQVDDVCVRPDFIMQHVKWHLQSELFLVSGAKFEDDKETWQLASCRRAFLLVDGDAPAECDFQAAWGASLSFTRQLKEKCMTEPFDCPYDERMLGWGYQETELAFRVQQLGARIVYDPSAGVFHRKHILSNESYRGFDRNLLVETGTEQNVKYLCAKHSLSGLPKWKTPVSLRGYLENASKLTLLGE